MRYGRPPSTLSTTTPLSAIRSCWRPPSTWRRRFSSKRTTITIRLPRYRYSSSARNQCSKIRVVISQSKQYYVSALTDENHWIFFGGYYENTELFRSQLAGHEFRSIHRQNFSKSFAPACRAILRSVPTSIWSCMGTETSRTSPVSSSSRRRTWLPVREVIR